MVKEFSKIYIYNLKGNARARGKRKKIEGGSIFVAIGESGGSQCPITLTFLVHNKKNSNKDAKIYYKDIGDGLMTQDKLDRIRDAKSILLNPEDLIKIVPDQHGDWINQRKDFPKDFIPLCGNKKFDRDSKSFFITYSLGVVSGRDAFVNNFSKDRLKKNVKLTIEHYRSELERVQDSSNRNPKIDNPKGVWTRDWRKKLKKGQVIDNINLGLIYECTLRPFTNVNRYYAEGLNDERYQTHRFYPSKNTINTTMCLGIKTPRQLGDFSVFISNKLVDRQVTFGQCIPMYYYPLEYKELTELGQILAGKIQNKYENVTDYVLNIALNKYPNEDINKTDLFYYAYGFLHSKEYKTEFEDTLVRENPSIKLVDSITDFWSFVKAGRQLAELHINYENLGTPEGVIVDNLTTNNDYVDYKVTKIKYKSTKDKSIIKYNSLVTIRNIPERVYSYKINGKSVIDTFIKYHAYIVDKNSGLVNDVNDLAKEKENPRYVLDLLLGTINAALQTLDIVEGLPKIKF